MTDRPTHRLRGLAIAVAAWLALGASGAAAEEPLFPAGSRIGLVPPPGFAINGQFQGFMREDTLSSIVLVEMPVEAFPQFEAVTPAAFAAQGMQHVGTCRVPSLAVPQVCHRVTQDSEVGLFRKWFLVLGHAAFTAQVVVNVPDEAIAAGRMSEAEIEAALATIALAGDPAEDPRSALPFTLDEGPHLAFQAVLSGSAALFVDPEEGDGRQPTLVAASSLDLIDTADAAAYARSAFARIATVEGPAVTETAVIEVAGMAGVELQGEGRDSESQEALYLYQALVLRPDGGYFRVVGIAPKAARELYESAFRAAAHSLRAR
jgi:hypothetical protein